MTRRGQDRRQNPRVSLSEAVKGQAGRQEVLILDLGLGGVRLAHTDVLRPRSTCALRFTLKDESIALTARIVWSCMVGRAPDGVPLYQSGLAFTKAPSAVRTSLAALLEEHPLPPGISASVEPSESGSAKPPATRRRLSASAKKS
ncbi:MAG TPA: PilZ domain-containing protein [Candidatus Sulfotelmatobacter sp.]|nr:PilZ domain-containing protein [Candidatus Sulfotelmatobacter sp.]